MDLSTKRHNHRSYIPSRLIQIILFLFIFNTQIDEPTFIRTNHQNRAFEGLTLMDQMIHNNDQSRVFQSPNLTNSNHKIDLDASPKYQIGFVSAREIINQKRRIRVKRGFRSRPRIGTRIFNKVKPILKKVSPTKAIIGAHLASIAYRKYNSNNQTITSKNEIESFNITSVDIINKNSSQQTTSPPTLAITSIQPSFVKYGNETKEINDSPNKTTSAVELSPNINANLTTLKKDVNKRTSKDVTRSTKDDLFEAMLKLDEETS